jgi:hypothetical protein
MGCPSSLVWSIIKALPFNCHSHEIVLEHVAVESDPYQNRNSMLGRVKDRTMYPRWQLDLSE